MIVVTVFEPNWISISFKNCHYDHIPFTVKGNGNIVFSVQRPGHRYPRQLTLFRGCCDKRAVVMSANECGHLQGWQLIYSTSCVSEKNSSSRSILFQYIYYICLHIYILCIYMCINILVVHEHVTRWYPVYILYIYIYIPTHKEGHFRHSDINRGSTDYLLT